jgi:hypothetical protein
LMELIKTTKFKISLVSNQSSPEAIQIWLNLYNKERVYDIF